MVWGLTDPGAARTCPRSTDSRSIPRNNAPILSPASPLSSSLRNISTPVQTVSSVSRRPIMCIGSPILTRPLSTRPVTTVPRPEIVNISSIGIKKGKSTSLSGCGMKSSTACINSIIGLQASLAESPLDSKACKAEPATTGISSPGKSYSSSNSRTSISTSSSNSSSSTISALLRKTTMCGTFTCLANKTCSRVCGIGPSAAETTRIAPSIWAAPVIMFLI